MQTFEPSRDGAAQPVSEAIRRLAADAAPPRGVGLFAELLYASGDQGVLGDFSAAALADYAVTAYGLLGERRPGEPRLRIRDQALPGTVALEILNDDMPFLVDSIMGEIHARGLGVRLVLHPILKLDGGNGAAAVAAAPGNQDWGDGRQVSYIAVHFDRLATTDREPLVTALQDILRDVRTAVSDWRPMLARLAAAIASLERVPAGSIADRAEALDFLRWLQDDRFTFLGMRDYRLSGDGQEVELVPVDGGGLGLLQDPNLEVLRRGRELVRLTPEVRQFLELPQPLIITKSNVVSRVHNRLHMDYIGVKLYDDGGRLSGELRIIGLFSSTAYNESVREIPYLRHKVATVLARSGHPPASHGGKALLHILETFPRDELFQIGLERLTAWTNSILDLELRPRTRVFARVDRFDRFVSVVVYTWRDRYSTTARERISALLAEAYQGRIVATFPSFLVGPLVRVHFIVARYQGPTPACDTNGIENRIDDLLATWQDRFIATARAHLAADATDTLIAKYQASFSAGYTETFPPTRAIEDIERIERLGPDRPLAIDFYREPGFPDSRLRAAVYRFDAPVPLSERVPVLENFGFKVIDERSYRVHPHYAEGHRAVCLNDMVLETADGAPLDLAHHDLRLEESFIAVLDGHADSDGYNQLVVAAGLSWREVVILRAVGAYLRQLGVPFGQRYMADTLKAHATVARDLVALLRQRHQAETASPGDGGASEAALRSRIDEALAAVPSLDEDRILRSFASVVDGVLRTNAFSVDAEGRPPQAIAFKLASRRIDSAPEPRPLAEIWLYSPRVEGVHLRFAPIARGGIRWSDRAQDFRTEVLGLAKAQQVKNAVIVPAGAKGGFVAKQLPRGGSREDVLTEGIASYRIFVSTLLDLTDNLVDGAVVPPAGIVRLDGDDPYLVVAADKGTATFSDYANEISTGRGFWLGDAFASGGSAGYDHKRMGITARGAWECVKRHFREMDRDIQSQPFTAVGIGDMSGDVFGNGALLSRKMRLLAAFDHRHIFLDPNPDPEAGFAERRRLFDLPRSSWQDYDSSKLSKGGGVFARTLKSVPLSPEVKRVLAVNDDSLPPSALIRAILKARVDLLWFGGIGTYVRGSTESDDEVGDRANDALRITGADIGAKVVGEGANLGMTQRARIEFAERGGRLNTDFIDNSAGVNTSDQEVNIKIALGPLVQRGSLAREERDRLLVDMTEDVAKAVLANNHMQSLALSLGERRGLADLGFQQRLMLALEAERELDRGQAALPSDGELMERMSAGRPLTRPELAVLLSHAKISLLRDLLESRVPDEPVLEPLLVGYFPPLMRERFREAILAHPLRREIVATGLTNAIVNRGGSSMAVRLAEETGRSVA
ncbi:MAG: NAD-glutamate dehydrogenase, partial [Hyphomicrobiaceae bacterium]